MTETDMLTQSPKARASGQEFIVHEQHEHTRTGRGNGDGLVRVVRVVRGQILGRLTPPRAHRAWLLASAALAAPTLAFADPAQTTPVSGVVVTATQLPTKADEVPDLIVINRDEIDAKQAVYATDVLSTVPGLALSDNGGFGGVTSVRMRGASSDKTLVLIDGVPQNDPSQPAGSYDFSTLDLSNVEKIEILEGPQSSIWGSDAIGGVIAITSRELNGWTAQGEGGSLTSFDAATAVGFKLARPQATSTGKRAKSTKQPSRL